MSNSKGNRSIILFHIIAVLSGGLLLRYFYGFQETTVFWVGFLLALTSLNMLLQQLPLHSYFLKSIDTFYLLSALLIVTTCNLHLQNESNYGSFISESMIAIFQSDVKEIFAYLEQFGSNKVLYISLSWVVVIYLSYFLVMKSREALLKKDKYIVGLSLVLGIAGSTGSYLASADIRLLINEASAYSNVLNHFSSSRELFRESLRGKVTSKFEGNIILVIGESTPRHHLSLYNYFRTTTPGLDAMKQDLVVFTDIISTHSHTTESLSDVLVLNNRENRDSIYNKVDLISILNEAGFKTTWLSNQNATGIWDNVVSVATSESDEVKFHASSFGEEFLRDVYDDSLIDSLSQRLTMDSKKEFFVIHTMAGHFPYCGLLPDEYKKMAFEFEYPIDESVYGNFLETLNDNPKRLEKLNEYTGNINCFDGAMLYIDNMITRLIHQVSALTEPSLLIYFADHGEAPLMNSGHESRMHSHFHVEVPFIIFANQAYKDAYPNEYHEIKASREISGSLIDLPYTLLGMAQVNFSDYIESRNMVSGDYETFKRTTLHEKVGYDIATESSDFVERTRSLLNKLSFKNKEKVWAHRVNSLGKMMQASSLFSGIELDISFEDQLKVNHPPARDVGLTLNNFLSMDNGKLSYWLDIKNLNGDNYINIFNQLAKLDKKHSLKKRTLFETNNIQFAEKYINDGWLVSYYLPTDAGLQSLVNDKLMKNYAASVINHVEKYKVGAISFDVRLMPIYEKYIIRHVKKNSLKVYVWDHNLRIDQSDNVDKINDIVSDSTISALLVNFPSPFGR